MCQAKGARRSASSRAAGHARIQGESDGGGEEHHFQAHAAADRIGEAQPARGIRNPAVGQPGAGGDLHQERRQADFFVGAFEPQQACHILLAQHARQDDDGQDEVAAGPDRRGQDME